jgi:hypothetical protein
MEQFSLEFCSPPDLQRPRRAMWSRVDHVPARRVIQQRPKRVVGFINSAKAGQPIVYESLLERDYVYVLQADSNVVHFTAQPIQIRYRLDGPRAHIYTPDFLVEMRNGGRFFVEIKPDRPRPNEIDYALINRLLEEHGMGLHVVREAEVRQEPRLSNARLCHRYSRYPVTARVRELTEVTLQTLGTFRCIDLPAPCLDFWPQLVALIAAGQLSFDPENVLTPSTSLTASSISIG